MTSHSPLGIIFRAEINKQETAAIFTHTLARSLAQDPLDTSKENSKTHAITSRRPALTWLHVACQPIWARSNVARMRSSTNYTTRVSRISSITYRIYFKSIPLIRLIRSRSRRNVSLECASKIARDVTYDRPKLNKQRASRVSRGGTLGGYSRNKKSTLMSRTSTRI